MLRNRLIAGVLSAVMCTSAVLPNQALNNAGHEANAATTKEKPSAADYEIKSANSLGNFLQNAAAKEDVQNPLTENACNSQFQITSLEFDSETGTVRVASTQQTEAKIVVSFVNDETSENVFSVETTVEAGKLINSELKADASKLPQYYLVKAQLFDPLNRPVGTPYTFSKFTKDVQEIIATDITAFDEEQVVNLDEDDTTNFIVLNEETIMAESSEDQNTLVSADYDNNVFVFDNADETVASLQEGELFFIQPDEENIIAVNVESVEKDGDTVTVSGNDEIDDMFDFVKIETDADTSNLQIDTSYADEGMSFPNVDENGDVIINDDGSFDFTYNAPEYDAVDFEITKKKVFNLKSLLDPETKDPLKDVTESHLNLKPEYKLEGTLTVELYFDVYIGFTTRDIEFGLKVTPAVTFTLGFTGKGFFSAHNDGLTSLGAKIAKLTIPTSVPSIMFDIEPRIFAEITGNLQLTVKWENIFGFVWDNDGFRPKFELFKEENSEASLKVCGSVYAGLELAPKIVAFSPKVASAGFDFKAGFKVSVSGNIDDIFNQYADNIDESSDKVIVDSRSVDYYHACKFCLKGTVDFVAECDATASALRKKVKKNIFKFTVHLPSLNFHVSYEDGCHMGECNYNRYRVNFFEISDVDGGYIPAVVKLDDKETTVGPYGATFYCLPGTYNYTITYEGKTLRSDKITVTNSALNPEFKEHIKVDDDGKVIGVSNGDSSIGTGEAATTVATTKKPMVTNTLPAISFSKDKIIAETDALGDNISYMLYPDGYLYICGHGDMYDFSSSPFRDPSIIKKVVIENDDDDNDSGLITSIGNNVFYNCSNMTSISMPNTIKRIGNGAFRNCSSLPKATPHSCKILEKVV